MRNVLAIETATDACSVALWSEGEICERFEIAPRQHARIILEMIDSVLAESDVSRAQLDGIAFGRGPGAFTGLRIAASVAQGIAYGLDLPVAPVSTLAALAHGVISASQSNVIVLQDARMSEVYAGSFQISATGTLSIVGEERVVKPSTLTLLESGDWIGVGSGWFAYPEEIATTELSSVSVCADADSHLHFPSARNVVSLAVDSSLESINWGAPDQAVPVYLRDNVTS